MTFNLARIFQVLALAAAIPALVELSPPASADTISLQCVMASSGDTLGNFSGESVYVVLDLEGHTVVSGYGDAAMHDREKTSALVEESDRLTWTYNDAGSNYSWTVDYVLDRSTLKLMATAGGVNIAGNTNTGNVAYTCSKVTKQI